MKSIRTRLISLMLAAAMLVSGLFVLTSCGENGEDTPATQAGESASETDMQDSDPFYGVDYKGREFRIHTSTNAASTGMGNSNFLIQGTDKTDGNAVNDAVFERNLLVEDKLGVKLVYTQADLTYLEVVPEVRRITSAGSDDYDLIINDLYPFANLSVEGSFRNILSPECVFDFGKDYWYAPFMDDLRLMDGYEYMLAGDYFIDVMRSAHLLLFNKDMYEQFTHSDPNEVYSWVTNYEWTYEKMNEMITGYYNDLNQNNKVDAGDRFGYSFINYWGTMIGYIASTCSGSIHRDEDGVPSFAMMENDRASDLVRALTAIGSNPSAVMGLTTEETVLLEFTEGKSLICDYQRLGSLENPVLRDMKQEMGVLPLPMVYASDKQYVSAAHDTSEVGAILATSTDLSFISTVIEVLNRETASVVIPKYYKEALQIQYVNDPHASEMIGIIHDGIGGSFLLAYNNIAGNRLFSVFCEAMQNKREFSVVYKGSERSLSSALKKVITTFQKKNGVA